MEMSLVRPLSRDHIDIQGLCRAGHAPLAAVLWRIGFTSHLQQHLGKWALFLGTVELALVVGMCVSHPEGMSVGS